MTDSINDKSMKCNDALSQSAAQANQESNEVNADLLTNTAAAAAAAATTATSLDTTDLEQQETYLQASQQIETTTHSCHEHSYFMPDLRALEDTLILAKQMNDGQVPEGLQQLAATQVDDSDSDSNLNDVVGNVTKQVKKAETDIESNKHGSQAEQCTLMSTPTTGAIQHQQSHNTATMPTLTVSSRPPRPHVLAATAEDSVRHHYVLRTLQATASRLIANSAVTSLTQQLSNVVSSAGAAQAEDLVVAVPVEEDEVHGYAVSHDVSQHERYKQVQMVRVRRINCCLYFVVFLLVAVAAMITSIVVIKTGKSDGQEEVKTMTWLENMTQYNPQGQLIVSIMGADAVLLNDASSPYTKALTWLLQSNERNNSEVMTSTLAQRFYAACFYFDTTTNDHKWAYCNPPDSASELDQTCHIGLPNGTVVTAQAWLSDSHECEWYGVRCDKHQQITSLYLDSMNLVGTIPSSIAKFPCLQKLVLYESQLEGNISLLSDTPHLTYIGFFINLLTGDLSSVWQHRKLKYFSAYDNNFTGSLSSQIGNLVDLKELLMGGNELTGTVPSEVGWLDSIFEFGVSYNHFRGELPSSMQLWSMIEQVDVSSNSLSGTIPAFLGQLNNTLYYLDLRDNRLTGTLPDELFHLTELIVLDVSNNELSGTLDARIAQFSSFQWNTSIWELGLSGNHFSGTIPTELFLLTYLGRIYLQGNDFTGSVPVPAIFCRPNQKYRFNNGSIFYHDIYADCAKDNNGQVELQCDCCTDCCQADGTHCQPNLY